MTHISQTDGSPPTIAQQRVLRFVQRLGDRYGFPVPIATIADDMTISVSVIRQHLKALKRKGLVSLTRHDGRTAAYPTRNAKRCPDGCILTCSERDGHGRVCPLYMEDEA